MATKLKNLSVTSVDLVDRGANPDAHIRLFKRRDDESEHEPAPEPNAGPFQKFMTWLVKAFSDTAPPIGEETSIMETQAGDEGEAAPVIQELQGEKEETDTMKIDKSKMTLEERAVLAEFEKKYGMADPGGDAVTPAPADNVGKAAEPPIPAPQAAPSSTLDGGALHPDVAKALSEFEAIKKQQIAEIEALKKNLEIEHLTTFATKYEVLGKKAPELAEKLYELKKAGGTVYGDYVSLLDESVAALTKSGLFGELGSSRQGSAGTVELLGIKAAELEKSAQSGMSSPDAIIKAWEENPELAAQYEAEYFGQ